MARKRRGSRSWSRRLWKLYFIGLAAFILFMVTVSWGWWGYMPDVESIADPRTKLATEIYSEDGEILGKLYDKEDRSNIEFSDIPTRMVDALIATEDIRYRSHSGIDFKSLVRAISKLGRDGGGSTISQQLAKNLFHKVKKKNALRLIQKFKEWIIAVQLEKWYSKNEIITMYFNTVPWANSYGIKSAASTFFNKPVNELKLEEAALLIGMLRGSSRYSPKRHPEAATLVRNVVLNQMKKYDYLDKDECDSLKAIPMVIDYHPASHNRGMATYFRAYIQQWLRDWCRKKKYDMYEDGLKIYTTIDSRMQTYAEAAVNKHMHSLQDQFFAETKRAKVVPWRDEDARWKEDAKYLPRHIKRTSQYKLAKKEGKSEAEIDKIMKTPIPLTIFSWDGNIDTMLSPLDSLIYYKQILHTGFMAMNPKTGYVKAWVGGIDFRHFQYDHVNRNSTRQVGSTFKPIVYARAVEDHIIQPCEMIATTPVTFELEDGNTWTPRNSSNPSAEELSVYDCLKHSINTGTARVMKRMEPNSPLKVKDFSDKLGIETKKFMPYPSICLGTMDVSVFEMVGAYSAFVNSGVWTEPIFITRIEDKNGNILEEFVQKTEDAMNKQTAYVMCKMIQKVAQGGTATRLSSRYGVGYPVGGKTGTTQDNSDGWFVGISPDLVGGCWVGCEDRQSHFRSTSLGQGANTALPIFGLFMKSVLNDKDIHISREDFEKPDVEFDIEVDCDLYKQPNHDNQRNDDIPGLESR